MWDIIDKNRKQKNPILSSNANKAIYPFEIHLNIHEEIEKLELLTDIHFVIK